MKKGGQKIKVSAAAILLLVLLFSFSVSAQTKDSIDVYVFFSETCPICQSSTLELRNLHSAYSTQGIEFIGLFPNKGMSSEESIKKFGKKYKLGFELKKDEEQTLVKQFSATVTPQVFVVRKSNNQVLYNGKIDNNFEAIGKRRQVVTEHYLKDALVNILHRQTINLKETQPVGCFIVKQ